MTAASIFRSLPTANDAFKDRYRVTVRVSLGLALAVHALAFSLIPALSVRPYRLPPEEVPVVFVIPDAPALPASPPDEALPPRPGVEPVEPFDPAPPLEAPPPAPPLWDAPVAPRSTANDPGVFLYDRREPVPVALAKPLYPRLAREAGIEGRVVVRVLVDEHGRVADAVVIESDATPGMVEAALRAARACRFEPARQRDVVVSAHVTIPFSFSLR
ncbi:MAG TPA: TonB family protein [Candidatus Krumholzibacteria bacterium]|nr:TonB family protein [Candidatus Krumholzibacteria bacterium]